MGGLFSLMILQPLMDTDGTLSNDQIPQPIPIGLKASAGASRIMVMEKETDNASEPATAHI